MGRIKSALEIALERTETVKGDKDSISQFDAKQKGKKLASTFLAEGCDLASEIKKTPKEQQESLKQGIFDVLITFISLPTTKDEEKRIENAGKGLQIVLNDSHFAAIYKQFTQAISQFLKETAQYDEAIRRQYAPKLRQKEEELSRRVGAEIRIDPFQDPEFVNFYNQNMNALKANYAVIADKVREEARRIFGQSD